MRLGDGEAGIEQLQGHGLVLAVSDSAVPLKVRPCVSVCVCAVYPPGSSGMSP